jgi:C4-dicarboxylate transporter DctM subunit
MSNVPLTEAAKWAIPFVLCEVVVMLLATFVPVVTMTLPNLLKR